MKNINVQKIIEAAEAGGGILRKYFGQVLEIQEKSTVADFRTNADTESEEAVLKVLNQHFPDFGIYSEESGEIKKDSDFRFVVDPLDGSNNFVLGLPNFSVAIALFKSDEVVTAVIHIPLINKTFWAQKGKGAFLNNKKIKVNKISDFNRSTLCYHCNYLRSYEYEMGIFTKLSTKEPKRLLDEWSPQVDFCLLADGKIEAIVVEGTEIYDFAAGKLIAKEAGAKVTDLKGGKDSDKNDKFLISNGTKIHAEILKLLYK